MVLAASNQPSSAWFALIGTLSGVVITGVITLVAAALTHRWQRESAAVAERQEMHRTQRRERIEIYTRFLECTEELYLTVLGSAPLGLPADATTTQIAEKFSPEIRTALNSYNNARTVVGLVAGGEVRQRAQEVESIMTGCLGARAFEQNVVDLPDVYAAERQMVEAMRRELDPQSGTEVADESSV